tara:strand:- start:517131 stop:517913 length:783 start_codon:yes stop_codon:yes gene_type:complete
MFFIKKIVFLLFIGSPFVFCFSQVIQRDAGQVVSGSNFGFMSGDHLPDSFLKSGNKTYNYNEIQGTPYIDNNQALRFNKPTGKIYTADKEFINTFFMRYNAYTDNVEVSHKDDGIDYYLLNKQVNAWYLALGEATYRAYSYTLDDQNAIGFFVIVSKTDTNYCTLLKKETVTFKDAVVGENAFVTATPPLFNRPKTEYYLKIGDLVQKVPKKSKDLFKLFLLKRELLKEYLSDHKYKLNKEEDLLQIVNYYNSIVNQENN